MTFHQKLWSPEGNGIKFKVLKGKNDQPGILHPTKLSFKNGGEIQPSQGNKKWKSLWLAEQQTQQQMLKEILQAKIKGH